MLWRSKTSSVSSRCTRLLTTMCSPKDNSESLESTSHCLQELVWKSVIVFFNRQRADECTIMTSSQSRNSALFFPPADSITGSSLVYAADWIIISHFYTLEQQRFGWNAAYSKHRYLNNWFSWTVSLGWWKYTICWALYYSPFGLIISWSADGTASHKMNAAQTCCTTLTSWGWKKIFREKNKDF